MNSRIIKAYIEMKTSQKNPNTPLIKNVALKQKVKRCQSQSSKAEPKSTLSK